ncbi:amino acid transporter antl1-like isoform x2 [Plakobranchus ocellatus]|uniref:Amino acid transporter antl1-like isoform x2 n=1 Tax=Plakobranchus ocellatus TaxID=259542 RepID=A0AAV3XZI2_9GAST|nr:amino acid transporter antl1-like isoform x2 [Plakobranchus ocellatus]
MVLCKCFTICSRSSDTDRDVNKNERQRETLLERVQPEGLGVWTAAMFIVGDVGGSGVLAFPRAVTNTGWVGFAIMLACTLTSAYTASLLGRCWTMVRERYPECKEQTRHPYSAMAEISFGTPCKVIAAFCVKFTCFGCTVVYLIVASENIKSLLSVLPMDFGIWLIIVAVILSPLSWLGTPKDFWPIAVTATLSTALACVFMLIQMLREADDTPPAFHAPLNLKSFLMAFGTMCFGFGGHQVFPTIQVDMKKPEKFGVCAAIAFFIALFIYFPVSIAGFLVYGSNLKDNVMMNIEPGPLLSIAQVLITLHMLTGFVIMLNPISQGMEDLMKIPNRFCFRRVLLRTITVGLILFTALTLPQFGAILALTGGSTGATMMYILPAAFYLKLNSMKGTWPSVEVPLYEKVACIEIIITGALISAAATYSALDALTYSHFVTPLYLS